MTYRGREGRRKDVKGWWLVGCEREFALEIKAFQVALPEITLVMVLKLPDTDRILPEYGAVIHGWRQCGFKYVS